MASKPKTPGAPEQKEKAPEKDKSPRERIVATAREVGVDDSGQEFETLFKRIEKSKSRPE